MDRAPESAARGGDVIDGEEAAIGAIAAAFAARWQKRANAQEAIRPPAWAQSRVGDLELLLDHYTNPASSPQPAARPETEGRSQRTAAPDGLEPRSGDRQGRLIRTPQDAEEAAAEYVRELGYTDARVTSRGADGGIDVVSATAVAQVKAEMAKTGRPVVQALHGIATFEQKQGLLFSLRGYTAEAIAWANAVAMPLFRFDLQSDVEPVNEAARDWVQQAQGRRARMPAAQDPSDGPTAAVRLAWDDIRCRLNARFPSAAYLLGTAHVRRASNGWMTVAVPTEEVADELRDAVKGAALKAAVREVTGVVVDHLAVAVVGPELAYTILVQDPDRELELTREATANRLLEEERRVDAADEELKRQRRADLAAATRALDQPTQVSTADIGDRAVSVPAPMAVSAEPPSEDSIAEPGEVIRPEPGAPLFYVRRLSPWEIDKIRTDASAQSSLIATTMRRPDGDEWQALLAACEQFTRDQLIEGTVSKTHSALVTAATCDIAADGHAFVDDANTDHLAEVERRVALLGEKVREGLTRKTDAEVRDAFVQAFIHWRGDELLRREVHCGAVLVGVHLCRARHTDLGWDHTHCQHNPAYSDLEEVRELPDGWLEEFARVLDRLSGPE